jgi:putative methyltransferase (TIGR04325 family)
MEVKKIKINQFPSHKLKKFIKDWLPPVILSFLKKIMKDKNGGIIWYGDFKSWEEAKRVSGGYEDKAILERVKEAAIRVKKGEAVYERDGVIFDEVQYSWPLLAGLMWIAAQNKGELNIIDFGGALGTTYFQNKKFLDTIPKVRWNIVEQKHFVDEGKKFFEDDVLKFYYDIENCLKETSANTILFSSVIQYLESPYKFLQDIKNIGFEFILFDRTPFVDREEDLLTVQKVPPEIYPASYPCWFFSKRKFYSFFEKDYDIIAKFESPFDKANIPNSTFEGCILRKRKTI